MRLDGYTDNSEAKYKAWVSNSTKDNWLLYEFEHPVIVSKYVVTGHSTMRGQSPKEWIFQGSNNGIGWDNLESRNNEPTWDYTETREYTITNTKSYKMYRMYKMNLYWTDTYGAYATFAELHLRLKFKAKAVALA